MIVRHILDNWELLDNFDFANDYENTRDWLHRVATREQATQQHRVYATILIPLLRHRWRRWKEARKRVSTQET